MEQRIEHAVQQSLLVVDEAAADVLLAVSSEAAYTAAGVEGVAAPAAPIRVESADVVQMTSH